MSVPEPAKLADQARVEAEAFRAAARAAKGRADSPPGMVFLEVASVCNLACSMCKLSSPDYTGRKPRFISLDACRRALASLPPGVQVVNLQGLGEPLLHPRFPDIVRLCKEICPQARTTINTNASFLSRRAGELVNCGLDELYVSVNSTDPALFAASRDGASLQHVVDGIHALNEARRAAASFSPEIRFRTVAIRGTDYADLLRLARSLGVTQIGIQELCLTGDWITASAEALAPEAAEIEWLLEHFQALAASEGVAVEFFWPSRHLPGVCRSPWGSLSILSDGSVTPCCALSHPPAGVIGHIDKSTPEELWNGDSLRSFRLRFVEGQEPACRGCPLYRPWSSLAGGLKPS